ncbi:LPXTG cell wall anchor domain-containing protein [Bradyrhizobium elkanii]|uniref:LPXTG cell wall anchor domain-containing protein n=1 Tax=Bradyrhizobium elkanii TaxID=29448 RepID=A0A4U6RI44_BRAEL|nr:LPXTG cell wall anchor domain-containing protein [Bradyrhizobium sp. BR2003]TKV74114.1 LPXTG cell wall anchor domain-containing protein [Bradyrhizobium elkanii]
MASALLLSLQLSHWLIIAGAALVAVGPIGLVIRRRRRANVQGEATEPNSEPRPQLSPLPDILDSRPRKDRREI